MTVYTVPRLPVEAVARCVRCFGTTYRYQARVDHNVHMGIGWSGTEVTVMPGQAPPAQTLDDTSLNLQRDRPRACGC